MKLITPHGAAFKITSVPLFSMAWYTSKIKRPSQLSIEVLEVRLWTGLNALLTYLALLKKPVQVEYTGVEPYSVPGKYVLAL